MDVHKMTKDPYLCPPQTKHQKQQALQQQAQQMAQQQPTGGSSGTGQQPSSFGGGGSLSGMVHWDYRSTYMLGNLNPPPPILQLYLIQCGRNN